MSIFMRISVLRGRWLVESVMRNRVGGWLNLWMRNRGSRGTQRCAGRADCKLYVEFLLWRVCAHNPSVIQGSTGLTFNAVL